MTDIEKLFMTTTLVTAINETKTPQTRIIDTIFSRKLVNPTDTFFWEVKTGSETIMRNIKVSEPANVQTTLGRTVISCKAPRFAEKRLIYDSDLINERAFGTQFQTGYVKAKIAREIADVKSKIDRTREFMAVKALAGQITNEYGDTLVDFNFTSGQKPTLAAADQWDETTSDPIKNIRTWQKQMTQAIGNVPSWTAFCGFGVMNALLNNSKVVNWLSASNGVQIATTGQIGNLVGTNISEYYGSYKDKDGAVQDYIPNGAFILIANLPDAFGEYYAPVVDQDAKGEMFYSTSWEPPERDVRGRWIMVEARPLPVVFRPEAILYATVI